MAAKKAAESEVGPAPVVTETRLDTDTTKPATNAPGDAPADTTDPTERASTVIPTNPSPEALAAGTILGAVPLPRLPQQTEVAEGDVRTEEYDVTDAYGHPVRVRHYIDGERAGESERV